MLNKFKFSNYKLPHMSPLNNNQKRFKYDPADKKAFQALTR